MKHWFVLFGVLLFSASVVSNSLLNTQRKNYDLAMEAWDNGDKPRYQRLKRSLTTYPLSTYFEYNELKASLARRPYKRIDRFLEAEKNSYLGVALRKRWLNELAKQSRWQEFLRYYNEASSSDSLNCWKTWAEYKTNKPSALSTVNTLWTVGRSMPKNCDRLFSAWKQSGGLTPAISLARHKLALDNRRVSLAKYIERSLTGESLKLAQLRRAVYANSRTLGNKQKFVGDKKILADIVTDGLYRQAYRAPENTLTLWRYYRKSLDIPDEQGHALLHRVVIGLVWDDKLSRATSLYQSMKLPPDEASIGVIVRRYLRTSQWQKVANWITQLTIEDQEKEEWRYWLAKALKNGAKVERNTNAEAIYKTLATERSYYGFLAADELKQPYSLGHKPVNATREQLDTIASIPGIKRAKELFLLDKRAQGRAEWYGAIRDFSVEELTTAASLASSWGWHRQAIETMTKARYWDDVDIRFPVVYRDDFLKHAKKVGVSPTILMAIARQESALLDDAVSPVGATGLMQIMPATARETAKKANITYSGKKDLFDPKKNIEIGSRYIDMMLEEFGNNRILAAASYNAGPHRTRTWQKKSKGKLDVKVWIENIPFKETRHYVKNILAYSVIYSKKIDKPQALMTPAEIKQRL